MKTGNTFENAVVFLGLGLSFKRSFPKTLLTEPRLKVNEKPFENSAFRQRVPCSSFLQKQIQNDGLLFVFKFLRCSADR